MRELSYMIAAPHAQVSKEPVAPVVSTGLWVCDVRVRSVRFRITDTSWGNGYHEALEDQWHQHLGGQG